MANEEAHQKSPEELADRAWDLAKGIQFCMFTTWDGERQRTRPLTAHVARDEDALHFLVDIAGGQTGVRAGAHGGNTATLVEQVEAFPFVSLGFADPKAGDYVTISGKASVSNDRARIRDLFSPFAKAWWDSADDPAIRLITVSPEDAELWEGPNKLVAAAVMLTAAVTGAKPAVGEHGAVRL